MTVCEFVSKEFVFRKVVQKEKKPEYVRGEYRRSLGLLAWLVQEIVGILSHIFRLFIVCDNRKFENNDSYYSSNYKEISVLLVLGILHPVYQQLLFS